MGIGADWFNVVTPADGGVTGLINVAVQLTIGDPVVRIGNQAPFQEIEMDVAPFICPVAESTMVPIRFVAYAFGIPTERIIWDDDTKTVTIDAGARILQFTAGSHMVRINGMEYPMWSMHPTPVRVEAQIQDIGNNLGRMFLPYRALGEALGVTNIEWVAETRTAVYNAHLLR